MAEGGAGRQALDHVDRALAARPLRDGRALTGAVQALTAFRDALVARHRADGGGRWRPALERINGVISVVTAAAFPIGEVPWGELAKARGWLDALVREAADQ